MFKRLRRRMFIKKLEQSPSVFLNYCPRDRLPAILQRMFLTRTGKLPTEELTTFNEKIIWTMMFDATELKAKCADKYRVREYVAKKIGAKYLPKLYGAYDNPSQIDWDRLPDKFVLQYNAGGGGGQIEIVKDKSRLDIKRLSNIMRGWICLDYASNLGEMHYRLIPPKIIACELLDLRQDRELKLFCFNGKVEFIQHISYEKGHKKVGRRYYDRNWKDPGFQKGESKSYELCPIPKPDTIDIMVKLAEKLAADFNFVRVDFYELLDGGVKFGELTFSPKAGNYKYTPNVPTQLRYGAKFILPKRDADGFSKEGRKALGI